ncbi:MAG TPA: DUF3536 domain-containing protein, partial [Polyangiaceae bacterium]|nr:DUF3536 domain-containing protein [Polyangiaceae bacterium]
GHFYQPPRENAWLERVDRQESAHPFHDWNERIDNECYRANARARILDQSDRVTAIVNTYARINFNFGPTLLSWMEARAPRTLADIVAADKSSIDRFGRGSAMAQAYGHIILPLATLEDQSTQVRWGLRDFERRFGRKAEGMWLPETAVSTDALRALAREGVAFTVLAPSQCAAIRREGEAAAVPTSERPLDTKRPYKVELGDNLSIAVFFYDGETSRAVAFERLLASGDDFANRLMGAFSKTGTDDELVSIATDGETYGHHHRYGEMALAYALEKIDASSTVQLTNYASYLAAHPPTDFATIVENSAWSCAHGVGRWSADCGCRMRGDSNQAWRGPLRRALDKLRGRIDAAFVHAASAIFTDAWGARDAYIDVILDRDKADAFLAEQVFVPLDAAVRHKALSLMELQRHRMLMYTSCGWFFDDVSGIETAQILQYAARAIELLRLTSGDDAEADFSRDLERAHSTVPGSPTGREVYERVVSGGRVDLERLAATVAVTSLFGMGDKVDAPAFRIAEREIRSAKNEDVRFAAGRLTVESRLTGESTHLAFAVLHEGGPSVRGGLASAEVAPDPEELVRAFEDEPLDVFGPRLATAFPIEVGALRGIPLDERVAVVERIVAGAVRAAETAYREVFAESAPLLSELARAGVRPPRALSVATRVILEADLTRAARRDPPDTRTMRNLLAEAKNENVHYDDAGFAFELGKAIARVCAQLEASPGDDGALGRLTDMVEIARRVSPHFDLSRPQDLAWSIVRAEGPISRTAQSRGRLGAWRELASLLKIAHEE